MIHILDTYAWMEYFSGGLAGRIVKELIENNDKESLITLSITIGELSCRYEMQGKDFNSAFEVIVANSEIVDVSLDMWKKAGIFRKDLRKAIKDDSIGIMDAILVDATNEFQAKGATDIKIVTGDSHFKRLAKIPKYAKIIRLI
ncbi:PIN domain-containing protein [Candidatus Micrarchaeota archaeon]|nr:PIN domain-containing protein [Candidatus Micrarchaeota archaeon]